MQRTLAISLTEILRFKSFHGFTLFHKLLYSETYGSSIYEAVLKSFQCIRSML